LAVQHDPGNRAAWLGLVQLLEELSRPDDAFYAAAALVRTHPDFGGGQAELGNLLVSRNRRAEALPHLEAAVRLDPRLTAAHFNLAHLLAADPQKRREARAEVVRTLALDPDFPGARLLLSQLDAAEH
jgi:predicted Zn-dependent protease